jgi:hypothetical protein
MQYKQIEVDERRKFDTLIIQTDKNDLEKERKKRQALKAKINEAKEMRDRMLQEAHLKRQNENS